MKVLLILVLLTIFSTASESTWSDYGVISKTNPECESFADYVPAALASYTDLMSLKWSCSANVVSISQHLTNDCSDNAQYTYPVETDDGNCQKILEAWYTVTCDDASINAEICVGSTYTTPDIDTWVPDWGWTFTTPEVEVPDVASTCSSIDSATALACATAGSISGMACGLAGCTYHSSGCVYDAITLYCMPSLDCIYTLDNEYKVTLDSSGGCGTYEAPGQAPQGGANKDDSTGSVLSLLCFFAILFQL